MIYSRTSIVQQSVKEAVRDGSATAREASGGDSQYLTNSGGAILSFLSTQVSISTNFLQRAALDRKSLARKMQGKY